MVLKGFNNVRVINFQYCGCGEIVNYRVNIWGFLAGGVVQPRFHVNYIALVQADSYPTSRVEVSSFMQILWIL